MRTQHIVLGSILLLGVGGVGIVSLHAQNSLPIRPTVPVRPATVQVRAAAPSAASPIAGYRNWKRVNQKPHQVESKIALKCIAPTKEEIAADAADPHLEPTDHASFLRTRFVTVYVNKGAEQTDYVSRAYLSDDITRKFR